jgi:peptide/nickel transport system substrate-binding protein
LIHRSQHEQHSARQPHHFGAGGRLWVRGAVIAALVLTGCVEDVPKEGQQAATTEKAASAAPEAPDSGPAANAPKLDPGLLTPKVEDAPTGKYGGKVTLPAYDDPKTFNPPLVIDGESGRYLSFVFEGLVGERGDTFEVEPTLAESWTVGADQKSYIFKLRKGLKWHDGKPLTADDVVFTWMTVLPDLGIPWDARDIVKVEGKLPVVTKIDAETVKFELPKPFAPFLRQGATLQILPKHIYGAFVSGKGKDGKPLANYKWGIDTDVKSIVGNGPYMFDSYTAGERIIFKRNPYYYRVNRHKQPLPYVDQVVFPFLKNLDTAILKFKAGETDTQWLPGKDFSYMKPQEKQGNFTIVNAGPAMRTTYITFNLNPGKNKAGKPLVEPYKHEWFADARFRKAISSAIDRDGIIKNVYRGLAVSQFSPIVPKSPYFDPTTPETAHDPQKAMALLTEAGFKKDGDVLKDAGGHPVRFTMLIDTGFKEGELQANMMREDLSKLGIQMKIQPVTFNVKIAQTHESKDWEAHMGSWGGSIEPHGVAHLWQSHGASHVFNLNPSETPRANPTYPWEKRIDTLFAEAAQTLDEDKRKKLYGEFQHIVAEEQPKIFLPVYYYTVAVRNTVGNVKPSPYSVYATFWNSYELYRK